MAFLAPIISEPTGAAKNEAHITGVQAEVENIRLARCPDDEFTIVKRDHRVIVFVPDKCPLGGLQSHGENSHLGVFKEHGVMALGGDVVRGLRLGSEPSDEGNEQQSGRSFLHTKLHKGILTRRNTNSESYSG